MAASIGSGRALRRAALDAGCRTLLYEGGEAGRFTESSIRRGEAGVRRVLRALCMVDGDVPAAPAALEARNMRWVRADRSGICRIEAALGQHVDEAEVLGEITDPFGENGEPIVARGNGVVVGVRVNPLVYQGEAVVHIAEVTG